MVQGGMSCVKYLMFVFNFVFVVCGIILIAVGAIVQKKDLTVFLDSKYVTAPNILIAVGVIIFILAFLGCCGAVKENQCMITLFGILLFLIFVVQIAGGITAYVYRGEFEGILKKNMNDSIAQQKKDSITVWNEMQHKLHCCGVDGPDDYETVKVDKFPSSCCSDEKAESCSAKTAYQTGCYEKLVSDLKGMVGLVGGVAIGICVVELLGCMFAWCLSAAIKKEYEGV